MCQGGMTSVAPGMISSCPYPATLKCASCGREVCSRHWDRFSGICLRCADVIDALPGKVGGYKQ